MNLTMLSHAIAVIGLGIGVFGGSIGIGIIGGMALLAMARQPEEMKDLRIYMLLMAALVEGLAFFCAVIAAWVIFSS